LASSTFLDLLLEPLGDGEAPLAKLFRQQPIARLGQKPRAVVRDLVDAFFKVGYKYSDICAEIYLKCGPA